jgi:hypothetical protein
LIDALPPIGVIISRCASGGSGENFGDFSMERESEEDVSGRTKVSSEEVVIMCDNECGGIG